MRRAHETVPEVRNGVLVPMRQLATRVPKGLHKAVRVCVVERGLTIQRAVIEALGLWLRHQERKGAVRL